MDLEKWFLKMEINMKENGYIEKKKENDDYNIKSEREKLIEKKNCE